MVGRGSYMHDYLLKFDPSILELEEKGMWEEAARSTYNSWLEDPYSLEKLLCAGTQLWYTLLMEEWTEAKQVSDRLAGKLDRLSDDSDDSQFASTTEITKWLMEVTNWGLKYFASSATFNSYFGYLIKVKPYYFLDYAGEYNKWWNLGLRMMKCGYVLDPSNPLSKAMYFETEGGAIYRNACSALWADIDLDMWGNSYVQQYFYRILCGPSL